MMLFLNHVYDIARTAHDVISARAINVLITKLKKTWRSPWLAPRVEKSTLTRTVFGSGYPSAQVF